MRLPQSQPETNDQSTARKSSLQTHMQGDPHNGPPFYPRRSLLACPHTPHALPDLDRSAFRFTLGVRKLRSMFASFLPLLVIVSKCNRHISFWPFLQWLFCSALSLSLHRQARTVGSLRCILFGGTLGKDFFLPGPSSSCQNFETRTRLHL